jgi:hypothetical protein
LAALPGCFRNPLPEAGELLHTNFAIGHRIRDRADPRQSPKLNERSKVPVLIIGGGIAGLSAAWRLQRAGFTDFLVLELEDRAGGTSKSGRRGQFAYPWAAHYIPVPMPHHQTLLYLLQEMGTIERIEPDGTPIVGEQFLCRDPNERLYQDGQWREGIYPSAGASQDDLRQLQEFRAEIDRWVESHDPSGRRLFTIPLSEAANDQRAVQLDKISMAQWLDQHNWDSPRLRWLVNYGCRDDYGLTIDQVSAWAGVFYFASRVAKPGDEAQSVITWPEGNGRVVDHFREQLGPRVECGLAVHDVRPLRSGPQAFTGPLAVSAIETKSGRSIGWQADQVIFAAPQMLSRHVVRDFEGVAVREASSFCYGSWLVANVHLRNRPRETGFPMCWDNVIHDSNSLGYVTATHQMGLDHGPTVLTWYHPFAESDSTRIRQQMLQLQWSDWAQFVLDDLTVVHSDMGSFVSRIDVMLWGHAMIQPRIGFVWNSERLEAWRPLGSLHFANTDLSGIALFEEAFDHGVRAAEEVLDQLGHSYERLSPLPTG